MLIRLRRLGPETERCSVCQDQNTWASVPLTARFTHTPPAHVYSQPTQTVCEWGPFFTPLPTSPLFLPNKHCTGNCRDCWDFSGGPGRKKETTRTRLLSVTPWRWVVGCTCEDGGSRVEGVTPALGGWWVLSLRYKQVKVTQFPVTPSSTSGRPGGCAKLDLSELKVRREVIFLWPSVDSAVDPVTVHLTILLFSWLFIPSPICTSQQSREHNSRRWSRAFITAPWQSTHEWQGVCPLRTQNAPLPPLCVSFVPARFP